MTQFLPPNLLALFAPRDPIPYLPPAAKLAHEKKTHGYFGVGQYVHLFEDPKDTPPPTKIETREERLERKQREKLERAAYIREQGIALWDPYNNPMATSDPFKTLFVARVCPDATESKLRKEFEAYGPVKKVGLIKDKISGKPRGYAFIEFENEKDMHSAYKRADGMKIEGRRVLVDVERGRTVKGWLPRRLGGGVEDTRVRPNYREDREEKSYRDRSFDRRDRDRSNKRSRSREKDRRRRNSREREHSRDHRDHKGHREHRDRHKDRFDNGSSSKPRNRDDSKYESARGGSYGDGYSDQKFSGHSYDNDSSGYNSSSSRRHRSNRDHDRERNKRHGRSRSRSPDRSERTKRSRYNENNNGQANQMEKSDKRHYQADFDMDMAEIEEGEDRSYENDPNGGYRKSEENDYDDDDYQDSYGQQQSSYA